VGVSLAPFGAGRAFVIRVAFFLAGAAGVFSKALARLSVFLDRVFNCLATVLRSLVNFFMTEILHLKGVYNRIPLKGIYGEETRGTA
jgi:hypothetical protein